MLTQQGLGEILEVGQTVAEVLRILAETDPDVDGVTTAHLAALYVAWGKPAEAAKCRSAPPEPGARP